MWFSKLFVHTHLRTDEENIALDVFKETGNRRDAWRKRFGSSALVRIFQHSPTKAVRRRIFGSRGINLSARLLTNNFLMNATIQPSDEFKQYIRCLDQSLESQLKSRDKIQNKEYFWALLNTILVKSEL